jgi:hypothetical protein
MVTGSSITRCGNLTFCSDAWARGRCLAPPLSSCGSRLRERNRLSVTLNGLDLTTGAAPDYSIGQAYRSGRCERCGGLMVLVMPVNGSGRGRFSAWNAIGLIRCSCRGLRRRASPSKVGFSASRPSSSPTRAAAGRSKMRTPIAILIVVLMATSSAFALKTSQHHSKRAVRNHHSMNKSDPGGTARNPADVDLDRKIGSICRGC